MKSLFRAVFHSHPALYFLLLFLSACSDSGTAPIPELVPLAGLWEARVLELPDPANPDGVIDLVPEGASYILSILSTGQFAAVFDLVLVQGFETGTVTVHQDEITLNPVSPPGSVMSGTWMLQGDVLIVEAVRTLDLNGDGRPEIIPFRLEFFTKES